MRTEILSIHKQQFSSSALRSYDISFDQQTALQGFEANEGQQQFLSYMTTQMETHLGERFNVSLSRYEYGMYDGELWGKDMNEPFIKSLKRGRDYRREHGNPIDFAREDAEVIGFEKIQNTLCDPLVPLGTIMLSISPRGEEGSVYQHNFYDVFTVKEKEGKRYIETLRFASALGVEEYKEKLAVFSQIDQINNASDFLSNPIQISNALAPEDIHYYLQNEKDFLDENNAAIIYKSCAQLIKAYGNAIIEQPDNDLLHKTLFNTILNKADEVAEFLKNGEKERVEELYVGRVSVNQDVSRYGFYEVKTVMSGCGVSGGYETSQKQQETSFSVGDFGGKNERTLCCTCPFCKKEVEAPISGGRIRCPKCNKSATWKD